MKELIARFQPMRWGVVRKVMEQIPPHGYATFRIIRLYIVKTTIRRMNYVYEDRHYTGRRDGDYYIVERTK